MPYSKNIKTICVCGAGTMGSGIAQIAAQSGYNVIQFDVAELMLEKSKSGISGSLQKLTDKNKITEEERKIILSRLSFTNKMEDCKADVIIEAIIENKESKIDLFNKLALLNSMNTIFATN